MRVVPSGADDVTDAIANALSISFEDAERIKNQIGLQKRDRRRTTRKSRGSHPRNHGAADRRHPQYAQPVRRGPCGGTISGVVLTGTGARLIGLPPVLASSINKVVRIGDPFIRFRLSKEVERQNIMAHAIDLGAVLGLVIGKKPR